MLFFVKLFSLFVCYRIVLGAEYGLGDEATDKGSNIDRGKMWFGPRLGKRDGLQEADKPSLIKLLEAADNLQYYFDQLQPDEEPVFVEDPDNKDDLYDQVLAVKKGNQRLKSKSHPAHKVIFTPKLGRSLDRHGSKRPTDFIGFTPRLGRRITEDPIPSRFEEFRLDDQVYPGRFVPRFERNLHFTPRLGRQLNYDDSQSEIRVARSVNATKNEKSKK